MNRLASSLPFDLSSSRRVGDVSSAPIATAISPCALRIYEHAGIAPTSGMEEMFDVITGTPAAIACAMGKPKPS